MALAGPKPWRVGGVWAPHQHGVRYSDLGFVGKRSRSRRCLHCTPPQTLQKWGAGVRNAPEDTPILMAPGHPWVTAALTLKPPWVLDRRGEGERGHRGGERTSARGDVG